MQSNGFSINKSDMAEYSINQSQLAEYSINQSQLADTTPHWMANLIGSFLHESRKPSSYQWQYSLLHINSPVLQELQTFRPMIKHTGMSLNRVSVVSLTCDNLCTYFILIICKYVLYHLAVHATVTIIRGTHIAILKPHNLPKQKVAFFLL